MMLPLEQKYFQNPEHCWFLKVITFKNTIHTLGCRHLPNRRYRYRTDKNINYIISGHFKCLFRVDITTKEILNRKKH
jgi:hypothetical protein